MGERTETVYFSSIPWTAGHADCGNWKTVIDHFTKDPEEIWSYIYSLVFSLPGDTSVTSFHQAPGVETSSGFVGQLKSDLDITF